MVGVRIGRSRNHRAPARGQNDPILDFGSKKQRTEVRMTVCSTGPLEYWVTALEGAGYKGIREQEKMK